MHILLVCSCGMSTSLLAQKMRKEDATLQISVTSNVDIASHLNGVDIVLVAPQVRFLVDQIQTMTTSPVLMIAPQPFGKMDAKSILAQAETALQMN